jgi:hypothetical protein
MGLDIPFTQEVVSIHSAIRSPLVVVITVAKDLGWYVRLAGLTVDVCDAS